VNGVSKRKVGAAGKGAFSGTLGVPEATHGPESPKLEGVVEAILSSSTGVRPRAPEEPFLFHQSDDIGVNTVSECVRPSISHKRPSSTRELSDATDLVLGPDLDLQQIATTLVLCSSSHDARLAQVLSRPLALLHSQHTVNSCANRLGYDLASSLQLVSSPGSLLSGSQPPAGSCGSHTPHESVHTRHFTRLSVAFSLWTLHTQNVPRMTRGQLRRAYTLTAHWQFPPTPRLSHLSFRFQAYIGFCSTETNILSAGAMAPSADPLFLRPESWVTQALRWRRKSALRPSRSWQDGKIYSRSNVAPARPL
jgi:hypothetical protein